MCSASAHVQRSSETGLPSDQYRADKMPAATPACLRHTGRQCGCLHLYQGRRGTGCRDDHHLAAEAAQRAQLAGTSLHHLRSRRTCFAYCKQRCYETLLSGLSTSSTLALQQTSTRFQQQQLHQAYIAHRHVKLQTIMQSEESEETRQHPRVQPSRGWHDRP